MAFAGPGFLVSVGYMDRQLGTDLAGARVRVLTAVGHLISNLIGDPVAAPLREAGLVTGRDLAQACRDHYPKPVVWALWVLCEAAIAACDLAEVVGSAIGLQLLFPHSAGVGLCHHLADVLIVLSCRTRAFAMSRRWSSRSSSRSAGASSRN